MFVSWLKSKLRAWSKGKVTVLLSSVVLTWAMGPVMRWWLRRALQRGKGSVSLQCDTNDKEDKEGSLQDLLNVADTNGAACGRLEGIVAGEHNVDEILKALPLVQREQTAEGRVSKADCLIRA